MIGSVESDAPGGLKLPHASYCIIFHFFM